MSAVEADPFVVAMQAAARKAVHRMVKARARTYRAKPWQMDILYPDLSRKLPHEVAGIADMLETQGRRHRLIGFGGEITLINIKAVRVLARWQRRHDGPGIGGTGRRAAA